MYFCQSVGHCFDRPPYCGLCYQAFEDTSLFTILSSNCSGILKLFQILKFARKSTSLKG